MPGPQRLDQQGYDGLLSGTRHDVKHKNQSRPNTSARASTRSRSQKPQLESDSLARTPQGAVEGYFPSSGQASMSATPAPASEEDNQSTSAASRSAEDVQADDPGASRYKDLSSEGGLHRLRESLSTYGTSDQRASDNAEEGIALPDNVKDFGKESGAPTPERLQTDSAALPRPGQSMAPTGSAEHDKHVHASRKAGSVTAPEAHMALRASARPDATQKGSTSSRPLFTRQPSSYIRSSLIVRNEPSEARSSSTGQGGPPQPFSLAGARKSTTSAPRTSHGGPPPGVAVPRPRPRDGPSWAGKARRKPLYSLGKPLPTHEEVQAQKEWEAQMQRIKEQYPDAQPPAPPPLPSQQETSTAYGAGGLQLDREQLQDVIRTVIAEFHSYQNGTLELGATRTSSGSHRPARRSSFYEPASSVQARKGMVEDHDEDGGSQVATIDSIAVEDDEDDPLPEVRTPFQPRPARIPTSKLRKSKQHPSSDSAGVGRDLRHFGNQPAFADDGRKEQQEREHLAKERAQEDDDSKPDKPQPAAPSQPRKRASRNSGSTIAEDETDKGGIEESPRKRKPSQASRILSRDHEEEGNWSDDGDDPHQLPPDAALADAVEFQSIRDDEQDDFPNPLAKLRSAIREPAAEFLGAMVLGIIVIGASMQNGLVSHSAISPTGQGDLSSSVNIGTPLASGIGVAISIYIAGGISGGHISPVISIVLACFRGFPWAKVPEYVAAQILGFTAGSGIAYGLYRHAISIVEGNGATRSLGVDGTASYLATYPVDYLSNANAFFNEFVAVALLVVLVLAIGDATNVPPPAGLNPLILMFTVVAIGLALGNQTGYALNPARDFGPRLVSWFAGYGVGVWSTRSQYWLWCVWLGDISGGLIGAALYDVLIFEGEESPMNWKWHWRDMHPATIQKRYRIWRKKIKVRNETRKESWLQRHRARKERKRKVRPDEKKEEV